MLRYFNFKPSFKFWWCCAWVIWITTSSDHRRVWTFLHLATLNLPSQLGLIAYSFVPNCREWDGRGEGGSNKMYQGGMYQGFLKWGVVVFLGHSLIIIKWTWGFFPKNLQLTPLPPCYSYAQKSSGLGNYFICKRFSVQTLLRSLELVIQIILEHDTITELTCVRK